MVGIYPISIRINLETAFVERRSLVFRNGK